ncbi:MAG: serine hydrolase [Planctomycetes bacterium]|nr:serine hydrolase [Planctomycetota bacterium]
MRSCPRLRPCIAAAISLVSCDGAPPDPSRPGTAAPHISSSDADAPPVAAPSVDADLLARCRSAADYSRSVGGEVMLVVRDGATVFRDAIDGYSVSTPHLLASGTKSFSGIAAALAVDDGLLSFDELVSDTITEWKSDPRKSKVTVRQLLSLASGLESLGSKIDNPRNARAAGITDRAEASVDAQLLADPGKRFIYGPSSFYVFGELMKRKLAAAKTGDADVVAYLVRKVFVPLGITPMFLRDEAGNANLPGGCRLSAEGWAVFGEMVRNHGTHGGTRIVGEATLAELMNPHGPNPAYGLTWWILRDGGADPEETLESEIAADRLEEKGGALRKRMAQVLRERARTKGAEPGERVGVMAAGMGKQRLYVLPDAGLTAVRFGPLAGGRSFEDREFLRLLLGD